MTRPLEGSMERRDLEDWDAAFREGAEHAREKYCSALIPVKYERKYPLADAWLEGFMGAIAKGKK